MGWVNVKSTTGMCLKDTFFKESSVLLNIADFKSLTGSGMNAGREASHTKLPVSHIPETFNRKKSFFYKQGTEEGRLSFSLI